MSLTPAIVILSPPGADEESLFEAESQSAVIPSAREVRFVDSSGVRRTLGTGGSASSRLFSPFSRAIFRRLHQPELIPPAPRRIPVPGCRVQSSVCAPGRQPEDRAQ